MESIHFDFHSKYTPVPPNSIYISMLVSMILSVCTRVRWKLAHYKHPEWRSNKETYGFKTPNSAPRDDDLKLFADLMFDIPNRIRFKNPNNAYQNKLKTDVLNIKRQNKVIVMADKTRNTYLCEPEDYNRYMSNAITKDYKKAAPNVVNIINKEAGS